MGRRTATAVIDKFAPGCPVVDLSHGVPLRTSAQARSVLADSLPFIRHDAIILAVVDPSVGRDHDIAIEADDGRLFVGPDNGLLSPAWHAAGGVRSAVSITSSSILLEPVSPSFHARDVLAPAAAHLAHGAALADLGSAIEAETLVEVQLAEPLVEPGKITCEVQDLNRFGNRRQLNVAALSSSAAAACSIEPSGFSTSNSRGRQRCRKHGRHVRRPPSRRVGPDGRPDGAGSR